MARANADSGAAPLTGWQVLTLRPAGQAGYLLRCLRRQGATARNLPLVRLQGESGAALAPAFADARYDGRWIFTSPAAVAHAARIAQDLRSDWFAPGGRLVRAAAEGRVLAPGPGTARALHRLGIRPVRIPERRLDSEGLLALPELAPPLRGQVRLVGAPGGRTLLADALGERGAKVRPIWVYRRQPMPLRPAPAAYLATSASPLLIASSLAMLRRLPAVLAPDVWNRLPRQALLVVASERLAQWARGQGFVRVGVAASAQTKALVSAALRLARTASTP